MTHPLAVAGAEKAAAHADRLTPEWSERAYKFLVAWITRRRNKYFMTEDVRDAASKQPSYVPPPDARAWGAVILRAKREGKIKLHGYAPMKSANCHGNPKSVWLWLA